MHPCRVEKLPAMPSPEQTAPVGVSVMVAPGPATAIDSPGPTPVFEATLPGPKEIAAGPLPNSALLTAVPPLNPSASAAAFTAASAEPHPSNP